jgi:ATP phosphoribosyltransferase
MKKTPRLRIAIQKSGRLAQKSVDLFIQCGLHFDLNKNRLLQISENFPIDLMLVRDDDIPAYIADGVCDLGIVGANTIQEKSFVLNRPQSAALEVLSSLNFGHCRLSLAAPTEFNYRCPLDLQGLKIATSYPSCVTSFLKDQKINAEIIELGGSVEIAPALAVADIICDLVSSGETLKANGLKEIQQIFTSQACLVRINKKLDLKKESLISLLMQRVNSVMLAVQSKYIMMNAPRSALPQILKILPGLEEPSVIPLGIDNKKVAIHSVAKEEIFWETIETLKSFGANSILVLPIEKMVL